MDMKSLLKSGAFVQESAKPSMFKELDATELYCPKCGQAVPVQKRLLLVLPDGDKYEYRCAFCAESVGTKMDRRDQSIVR